MLVYQRVNYTQNPPGRHGVFRQISESLCHFGLTHSRIIKPCQPMVTQRDAINFGLEVK